MAPSENTLSNAQLTAEYFATAEALNGDVAGRRAAFEYMRNSTAIVHEKVVACSFIPRLFNRESWAVLQNVAETTHSILCKVIEHYRSTPEYRSVFSFDERLVDLILLPRGYADPLPFARIDVFLNEETMEVGFCEFNGDGSAGMNENREITHSIEETETYKAFAAKHELQQCELFDSWVEEFISIYRTYDHYVEGARFAICDYLECGVVDEFHIFSEAFARHGHECLVCDVRDVRFDAETNTLLGPDGLPIHAIWRRSVTNDVIDHWDESQDLLNAVRNEAVALIGSFAGHLVHDKQIFEALRHPATKALLSEEENAFVEAHVPQTLFLDEKEIDLAAVRANKDAWIIKPTDNYGAKDVYAGVSHTQEQWEELVSRFANGASGAPFIVQTYLTPFKTLTLPPDADIASLTDDQVNRAGQLYNNLSGLYLYNGHFQGIFSRLGPLPTISKELKGITAATIRVMD